MAYEGHVRRVLALRSGSRIPRDWPYRARRGCQYPGNNGVTDLVTVLSPPASYTYFETISQERTMETDESIPDTRSYLRRLRARRGWTGAHINECIGVAVLACQRGCSVPSCRRSSCGSCPTGPGRFSDGHHAAQHGSFMHTVVLAPTSRDSASSNGVGAARL